MPDPHIDPRQRVLIHVNVCSCRFCQRFPCGLCTPEDCQQARAMSDCQRLQYVGSSSSRRQICLVRGCEHCWVSPYFHSLRRHWRHNRRRQRWIRPGPHALNVSGRPMRPRRAKWVWLLLIPPLLRKVTRLGQMPITRVSARRASGGKHLTIFSRPPLREGWRKGKARVSSLGTLADLGITKTQSSR
jgi:hypothetical protein